MDREGERSGMDGGRSEQRTEVGRERWILEEIE
jgi:hypothetical protein